jgi:transposase
MYIRTTTRRNKDGSVVRYLQIAESVWDAAQQRSQTRVLYNLGREDALNAEALRRLAESLLRVAAPEALERLRDAPEAAPLRFEWAKEYGGLHALRALWEELGLAEEVGRSCGERPSAAQLAEAAFLIVANRALAPDSKLGVHERWLSGVHWPAAEELGLHHLYLALDLLAEEKARLEKEIFFRVADLLSADVDLVFYDTTSVYFETEEEDEGEGLRRRGHSKDYRPGAPQIVVGLAITRQGLPVKSWIWPGNTADVSTIEQVKRDLAGWRLNRVVYVADGGMMSQENLTHLARGGSGYIVGVPLRKSKEAAAVLARPGRFRTVAENLEVKEVAWPPPEEEPVAEKRRRYVLCRNPEEAKRQKHRRDEMLRELKAELKGLEAREEEHPKAACALRSSRRFGMYLKTGANGELEIDQAKVAQEEKLDGKWLVITNDASLSTEDVALGYKQLLRVEESFRRLKHGIDIRPVHHRTPERIEAHVFACVLALLLERVAELRTGERWGEIRRQLGRLKMVAYSGPGGRAMQTTEITAEQRKLLQAMNIEPPRRVHHIG